MLDYLHAVIDSSDFYNFLNSCVTGTTGSRQRVAPATVLEYEFSMPQWDKVRSFTELAKPMFTQIRNLRVENSILARIRDALLPRVMSGEIDVSNVQLDEPAGEATAVAEEV